jgi:hypothetical protein
MTCGWGLGQARRANHSALPPRASIRCRCLAIVDGIIIITFKPPCSNLFNSKFACFFQNKPKSCRIRSFFVQDCGPYSRFPHPVPRKIHR